MAWSIGWDVPAQEPRFSDCSEVARLAKYLGVFDQQTLNLLFGLPGGLIFCSEDLCHHFTPCSRPTKPQFWLPRTSPNPIVQGTQQPHTAELLHATSVGKHHFLSSFAQKNHPTSTKTLCQSPSSPQTMRLFSMSFSFQSVQRLDSRSPPSLLILTPIPGETITP